MEEEKKELNPEEIKKKLEECEKQKDGYLAGWQRARADFLNYKKEEIERIGEILKYANAELILNILPILDNFEKAEKEIPEDLKNDKNIKGFLQIKIQFQNFLKNQGIEGIKAVGEKFDPNFHEAVEQVPIEKEESGKIIEEIQKGYKLNGKVIRPAKVRVTK
jgi:molecular chaperone GrpE